MAVAVGSVGYEERLSLVDHLAELRTRLIVSIAAIAVAFGFCMWQNHELLHIINEPLTHQTQKQVSAGNGPLGATYTSSRTPATWRASWRSSSARWSGPAAARAPLRGRRLRPSRHTWARTSQSSPPHRVATSR